MRARPLLVALAVLAVCAVLVVLDLCAGDTWLDPAQVVAVLRGHGDPGTTFLVRELRSPHVIGAVVVGAGLGLSGAITQSLLHNPLASPDIVGVTSGASCAAVVTLLGGSTATFLPGAVTASVPVAACVGGLLAGALVVVLGSRAGLDARRLVLVGLGVNAGLSALSSWLLVRADLPDIATAAVWLTGSLSATTTGTALIAGAVVAVCLVLTALASRRLDLLRLDPLTVRSLGVRVTASQLGLALLAVVAASATCAVAGPVGFVAFSAPQIAMALLGTQGPPPVAGALVGATTVVAADLASRTLLGTPVPVGLVTSLCGAPVLLWLLLRSATPHRRRGGTR